MITALFGASCSGKTTLGRRLAADTALPFRSCGDVVKERARHLGIDINDLAAAEHARIDDETRRWCDDNANGIVEGRYLDQVLAKFRDRMDLILLVASVSARAERWAQRTNSTIDEAVVTKSDVDDEAFRVLAYGETARTAPTYTLDTSLTDLEASLRSLRSRVGNG